jgi:hypothetical protein
MQLIYLLPYLLLLLAVPLLLFYLLYYSVAVLVTASYLNIAVYHPPTV